MAECNRCGACCKVLTLEQSPEEVRGIAALTAVLGIPSDHQFAARHWHPLTRDEAMRRNPVYTTQLRHDAFLYRCDMLGDDGLCQAHATRPLVCRGYPWYGQPPRDMVLAHPGCDYYEDQIFEHAVRRPEM
jgi:Fe-S-cluster containining protein